MSWSAKKSLPNLKQQSVKQISGRSNKGEKFRNNFWPRRRLARACRLDHPSHLAILIKTFKPAENKKIRNFEKCKTAYFAHCNIATFCFEVFKIVLFFLKNHPTAARWWEDLMLGWINYWRRPKFLIRPPRRNYSKIWIDKFQKYWLKK